MGDDDGVKVLTEAGTWHVRRRWAPRHLGSQTLWARFRQRFGRVGRRAADLGDVADPGCVGDLAEGMVIAVMVVVVVAFVALVGIPLLIALGELVILVVVAVAGLVGRVLFRRPWTVDAVSPSGDHRVWPVVGWRASGAARRFIAERIASSGHPPSDEELAAAVLAE